MKDLHRVYLRRLALGLSVKTLSAKSGISPGTINRIERSATNPYKVNVETALSLAKALDAPLQSLFRDEELSELGRTPKTGVATQVGKHRKNVFCMTCGYEIPSAYTTCQECFSPHENAAVAL